MSDEYKDYKDLDYDFPDTSSIINDYLGCQASTNDGKSCSLDRFKTFGSAGECEEYCGKHILKWSDKLFDIPLKTLDETHTFDLNCIEIIYNNESKDIAEKYLFPKSAKLYIYKNHLSIMYDITNPLSHISTYLFLCILKFLF